MQRDMRLVQKHKQLFKDFIYAEMREHAKQLELYCRLFEETNLRVNVAKEFVDVMMSEGRFP